MSQLVPTNSSPIWNTWENDIVPTMYTDSYNWHTSDYKMNSYKMNAPDYSQLDLNCQPSRTTPTLTSVPATMRSLEQTFLEDYQTDAESHQNQAGFVPPLVSSASVPVSSAPSSIHDNKYIEGIGNRVLSHVDLKTWNGGTTTVSDVSSLVHLNSSSLSPPIPTTVLAMNSDSSNSSSGSPLSSSSGRRNIGGRRPKNEKGISPEEDERRKQRRERNKLAAARCRKRRLDHTNELVEETQDLESKKQRLREEVEKLRQEKQELQFILDSHVQQSQCRVRDTDSPPDIKPFVLNPLLETQINSVVVNGAQINPAVTSCEDTKVFNQMGIPVSSADKLTSMSAPRPRPNSLPVSNTFIPKNKSNMGFAEMANISITTPSNGLMNFDSLIEGGTGLTPLASLIPSCSTQQRNSNVVDLSSPESHPNKLVSL